MLGVIGDYLGPAIGIALSPMAIVGYILMLVSAGGMAKAWAFIGGWAGGIAIGLIVISFLVKGGSDSDASDTNSAMAWVRILLGLLLVGLAWRQWQGRPKNGQPATLPKWMQAMDTVTPVKALGLGALLAAANPKNIPMLISSAGDIGQAGLNGGELATVFILFVIIASLGMLAPMIVFLAAGKKGEAILNDVREWLVGNNATIMAVLFLILGFNIIGKGLGGI